MSKHYTLIDHENVQPKSLSVLLDAPNRAFRIMVFVGAGCDDSSTLGLLHSNCRSTPYPG